jgi:hypothetical protein
MELSKLPPASPDHGRRGATPKRQPKPTRRPPQATDDRHDAALPAEEAPTRRIDVTA